MSARRGWCPGVYDAMPTGDGLLVRVKPPLGMVSAGAALALADASLRHGNGTIEITRRGNLQVRGLSSAGVAPFAAAIVGCGLAHADAAAERRRGVIAPPLIGDDPSLAPETAAMAEAIERGLIAERRLAALPAKFCVVVDGGGVLPLRGVGADIVVHARDGGFAVVAGGCEVAFLHDAAKAGASVLGLVRQFVMSGLDPSIHEVGAGGKGVDGRIKSGHDGEGSAVAFISYPQTSRGAFGIGIPFGAMRAATLGALAELAERYGDGKLRTTPWRAVILGGVVRSDASSIADAATALGLIVDPADKRRRVVACPGSPGCSSATVAARTDAVRIAKLLAEHFGTIHVSGCRKGCAHPSPAAVTLVGDDGRYRIVRDGRAGDHPEASGLTVAEILERLCAELAA